MSAHTEQGSLFDKHEIFTPIKTYPPMTVSELAREALGDPSKEPA
jgi:hypothetical protein